jgi:hypothetical protein
VATPPLSERGKKNCSKNWLKLVISVFSYSITLRQPPEETDHGQTH